LIASTAIALALAAPASAAAPNYILVSGPTLAHPILLGNWSENLRLLVAVGDSPRARGTAISHLSARPRLDLAEFWAWGTRPPPTNPARASQHGSYYPARGARPAVIVLMVSGVDVPRRLSSRVRSIFLRHGVPLRVR